LSYELGQKQLKAMVVFWEKCAKLGLIDAVRPLRLYNGG
jgi:hypothetical protein